MYTLYTYSRAHTLRSVYRISVVVLKSCFVVNKYIRINNNNIYYTRAIRTLYRSSGGREGAVREGRWTRY